MRQSQGTHAVVTSGKHGYVGKVGQDSGNTDVPRYQRKYNAIVKCKQGNVMTK